MTSLADEVAPGLDRLGQMKPLMAFGRAPGVATTLLDFER